VCNHQGLSGDNEVVVCACTFTKVNGCTGHRSKCRALNLYDKGGYPPSNGAAVHKSALNFKFALSKMTSSDPTLGGRVFCVKNYSGKNPGCRRPFRASGGRGFCNYEKQA